MPLYLITGSAGTGKSEVCRLLKEHGYEAYDTDDDALARWQHNDTGYIHPKSSVKAHQRTATFIAEHTWSVPRDYLENLRSSTKDRPVFICGSLGNEDKVRDVFQKIFALYVDDNTLRHRLATRINNDWGKQPHELEQTLRHHHEIYHKYKKLGDIVIDAEKSAGEVTEEILKIINS